MTNTRKVLYLNDHGVYEEYTGLGMCKAFFFRNLVPFSFSFIFLVINLVFDMIFIYIIKKNSSVYRAIILTFKTITLQKQQFNSTPSTRTTLSRSRTSTSKYFHSFTSEFRNTHFLALFLLQAFNAQDVVEFQGPRLFLDLIKSLIRPGF